MRYLAITALSLVYGLTLLIADVGRFVIRRSRRRRNRVILNCTFHNPNWFHAHVEPITRSGYGEIILVSDVTLKDLPNLRHILPPRWALRLFSRAGAKAIWTLGASIRYPADIVIGYHIFPASVTALMCARLTGAAAVYQVTSGPRELEGGGCYADNRLLRSLQRPSALVERLVHAVMRRFELIVVRGNSAKTYMTSSGFRNELEIVTGSVEIDANPSQDERDIDVLYVGRLSISKRLDRLIEVIARVAPQVSDLRVCIVGDGPHRQNLEKQAESLGIADLIEFAGQRANVADYQARAKIKVLTSSSEGVSIAMLESMGLGAVPVVSDVGDLRDFVTDDVTGYLLGEDDLDGFAVRIVELLTNRQLRERLSAASRSLILEKAERSVVASRWGKILADLQAGGPPADE